MNRLWKLWVTAALLYLLFARSHGGPGFSWVAGKVFHCGVASGQVVLNLIDRPAEAAAVRKVEVTKPAELHVGPPCEAAGYCSDGEP